MLGNALDFSAIKYIGPKTVLLLGFTGLAFISADDGITWRQIEISYIDVSPNTPNQISFRGLEGNDEKVYTTGIWNVFEIKIKP